MMNEKTLLYRAQIRADTLKKQEDLERNKEKHELHKRLKEVFPPRLWRGLRLWDSNWPLIDYKHFNAISCPTITLQEEPDLVTMLIEYKSGSYSYQEGAYIQFRIQPPRDMNHKEGWVYPIKKDYFIPKLSYFSRLFTDKDERDQKHLDGIVETLANAYKEYRKRNSCLIKRLTKK